MYLDRHQAQNRMNELGALRQPHFFIIDFEEKKCQIHLIDDIPDSIQFDINQVTTSNCTNVVNKKIEFTKFPISYKTYQHMFDQVIEELKYGNTFLINLTCKTPIRCNYSLAEIYARSSAKYKLHIHDHCVAFSPESFVKINGHHITSYPMKGTIDASVEYAEYKLMNNKKEKEEHYTIVDLIRNDLSIFGSEVHVPKFRYIDHISTNERDLLQVSSRIKARLDPNFHSRLGDILFSMLPAGSITGAPKAKTVEIIQRVEGDARGYYTGVMGIYDGKDLDSGVIIRYIEQDQDQLYYRSGGGITHQSIAEEEYQEMIDKIYLPFK